MEEAWLQIANIVMPTFKELPEEEQMTIAKQKLNNIFKGLKGRALKTIRKNMERDPTTKPTKVRKEIEFFLKYKGLDSDGNPATITEVQPKKPIVAKVIAQKKVPKCPPQAAEVNQNHISTSVFAQMFSDEYEPQDDSNMMANPGCSTADIRIQQQQNICADYDMQTPAVYHDNADWAFFESLIPVVCEMNDQQKLDFKIELMQLLKKY
ncbi:uncharacterized protein LOC106089579 isoform X2 [Stomoxys calcitrans]|nr:uncharacterized protein LOC106089579 isoform X2 [Stomoxys calcitrans]